MHEASFANKVSKEQKKMYVSEHLKINLGMPVPTLLTELRI